MNFIEQGLCQIAYQKGDSFLHFRIFEQPLLGTRLTARIGKKLAIIKDFSTDTGHDDFGAYILWCIEYAKSDISEPYFTGMIKLYQDFTIFEIHYKHN